MFVPAVGEHTWLFVRAAGGAPWREKLDLEPAAEIRKDVSLPDGATIAGSVRDADARPCGAVCVSAPSDLDDPRWFAAATCTAEDGTFVLTGLRAGPVYVEAAGGQRGHASTKLTLPAGATVGWSPTLDAGLRIRGRLLASDGTPLAGWDIAARGDGRPRHRALVRTDAEGDFQITGCRDAPYVLEVRQRGAWLATTVARRENVLPNNAAMQITVPAAELASATIEGQVLDGDGRARRSVVTLRLDLPDGSQMSTTRPLGAGPFVLGPLGPGRVELQFTMHGHEVVTVEPFDLGPNQKHELGTLRATPMGEVVVHAFTRGEGAVLAGRVGLRDRDGKFVASAQLADGLATIRVARGTYDVFVWGPGHGFGRGTVTVSAPERAETTVVLPAGVECRFRIEGELRDPRVTLKWGADECGVFAIEALAIPLADLGEFTLMRTLPEGRYTLALTGTLAAADVEYTVGQGEPSDISLRLRTIEREEELERRK